MNKIINNGVRPITPCDIWFTYFEQRKFSSNYSGSISWRKNDSNSITNRLVTFQKLNWLTWLNAMDKSARSGSCNFVIPHSNFRLRVHFWVILKSGISASSLLKCTIVVIRAMRVHPISPSHNTKTCILYEVVMHFQSSEKESVPRSMHCLICFHVKSVLEKLSDMCSNVLMLRGLAAGRALGCRPIIT